MKSGFRLVVAIAVSLALLWFSFRSVDFPEMISVIRGVDITMVVLFLVSNFALQVFRILRWGVLIRPFASIDRRALFRIGGVGMTLILLMPLRLGEFARPYMLKQECGAPISSGLGSVVIERAIDGLLVTLLFFCSTMFLDQRFAIPVSVQTSAYFALAIFASATVVCLASISTQGWVPDLIERLGSRIAPGLARKIAAMLRTFVEGLRALPDVRAIGLFILWTGGYWVVNGLGMYALALGFGWELPVVAGFLLVAILVIGIMIPAGPGFLGPYQFALIIGLGIFGIERTEAAAYAMLAYPLTVIPVLAFGLPWFFSRTGGVGAVVRGSRKLKTEVS